MMPRHALQCADGVIFAFRFHFALADTRATAQPFTSADTLAADTLPEFYHACAGSPPVAAGIP